MIASNLRRATVLQSPAYELRNTCDLVCRPLGTQIRSSWFRSCGQAQAAACAKGKSQRRSRPITQRSRNRGVKVVCFLATIINAVLFAAICLIPFMQCESEERGGGKSGLFSVELSPKGKTRCRQENFARERVGAITVQNTQNISNPSKRSRIKSMLHETPSRSQNAHCQSGGYVTV